MGVSQEKFRDLLTQAVYRIRLKENKMIQSIQDELGYALGRDGGSAIEYWRAGHIPAKFEDVELLARAILKRVDLGRDWLDQFLESAQFPLRGELIDQLYPGVKVAQFAPEIQTIPAKSFRRLVGRKIDMSHLDEVITDSDGHWIIGIDGMGGIGKSALALELVHRMTKNPFFDGFAWVSAASNQSNASLTFDSLLNGLAIQLGLPENNRLPIEEKARRLRSVLNQRRILVAIDNLDTALEPQEQIIHKLRGIHGISKFILTSRMRFHGDLFAVHLFGLDENAGIEFIKQEASERNIRHVLSAEEREFRQILTATDGCPLAIKLIVGQLGFLSLENVLHHLQNAQPIRRDINADEYVNFYRFIFKPSWELLSELGKKLLIAMAHFPPEIGGEIDSIQAVTQIQKSDLLACIDELWRLSFLEIGETQGLGYIRYFLHSLTQSFVRSDIVKQ